MKRTFVIVLFILLLSLAGYTAYHWLEIVEEKHDEGWSTKAQLNPFLAAEQYLSMKNQYVQSSNRLSMLDDLSEQGTIFISDSRFLFDETKINNLISWLNDGGHLIVSAQAFDIDEEDALLSRFDIVKKKVDCECETQDNTLVESSKKISEILREANQKIQENNSLKEANAIENNDEQKTTLLTFEGVNEPLFINFNHQTALYHPTLDEKADGQYQGYTPLYWASNDAGVQFIQFEIADGLLSVLVTDSIWQSNNIAEFDHAYLLSALTSARDNHNILLLYGTQMDFILTKFVKFAPEFFVSLVLFLVMWLIYKMRRFGHICTIHSTTRRSLEEHIQACGELLWRTNKKNQILMDLRTPVLRKIQQLNFQYSTLPKNQKIAWLSNRCQIPPKDIERALYGTNINSEEMFIDTVNTTKEIRNKL